MSTPSKPIQSLATGRLFWRAIAMAWQAHPLLALLALALMFVNALMIPLQVWITKLVIDGISAVAGQGGTWSNTLASWQTFLLPMAIYIGIWGFGQAKEGQLVEAGSHDELMTQGGEYAKMFTLQAERYQSADA